jgi:glycosyltransferase involved in cell wall biosynthesis
MALSKKYPEHAPPSSQIYKWLKIEKVLYKKAKFIFTTSENTKKSFINDYQIDPEKIITVRYGATLNNKPKSPKTYANKTILFIGKNFKRKGGYILLRAFQKVQKEINDAKLIIAGVHKHFLKIKQPGVKIFTYVKDKNIIYNLYKNASVFVMPSLSEPFGLVFLEAMGYKLPCIGSNVDAMPEIIVDETTGFLVNPNDVLSLSEKIIILLKNPDLCEKMGLAGYKRLNEMFLWDSLGDKLHYYLKKSIENR